MGENIRSDSESRILADQAGSPPTYWLTRFVILRLLGVVYAVGFLVAILRIVPLIGCQRPAAPRDFT